jgi:hypothetical protein
MSIRIQWGFNPDESGLAVLSSPLGRNVWALIRRAHIVDQHFNECCESFVARINACVPETVEELRRYAEISGLHQYGSYTETGSSIVRKRIIEWPFWQEMFDVITGKVDVIHEYPSEEKHGCTNATTHAQ